MWSLPIFGRMCFRKTFIGVRQPVQVRLWDLIGNLLPYYISIGNDLRINVIRKVNNLSDGYFEWFYSQTPCNVTAKRRVSFPPQSILLYSIISLYKCLITLVGLPPTTVLSSASFVMTAPATTILFSLTVTLCRMGYPSPDPAVPFQADWFVSEVWRSYK